MFNLRSLRINNFTLILSKINKQPLKWNIFMYFYVLITNMAMKILKNLIFKFNQFEKNHVREGAVHIPRGQFLPLLPPPPHPHRRTFWKSVDFWPPVSYVHVDLFHISWKYGYILGIQKLGSQRSGELAENSGFIENISLMIQGRKSK